MSTHEPETPQLLRAEDHVDAPRVRRVAIGSVVVFLVALVVAAGLLATFARGDVGRAFGAGPAASAAPVGTVERSLVLATKRGLDLRAAQRDALGRWGWVDRNAGIARIPIERAMEIVAEDARDGGAP